MNESQADKVSAKTKTILVIDDDPSVRGFLEMALTRDGFKFFEMKSGTEALSKIIPKNFKIDLIVLDLMMPGDGGYDVVKQLQETQYKGVPIFIVTAKPLDSSTIELFKEEPNVKEFFSKPISPNEFKKRVHEVLCTFPEKEVWEWKG